MVNAKIYIETNGCSHNLSDSEHMAGLLSEAGYELVKNEDSADLVLFNTCTVKTPTEHAFFNRLKSVESKNKKVVVGGCIPQADPNKFKDYSIVGTHQIDKVVEVVNSALNGQKLSIAQRGRKPELILPRIRTNPLVEILTINTGCLGTCTFCKTKAARGNLSSYSKEEIIKKTRRASIEGVKEFWLTSQDTACYGFDIGTNIAELISEICEIDKDFKIRLGMGNPDHFKKILDEVIKVMKNEKVFKFIHIPLQAGNNKVLKEMKREYTVEDYILTVEKFKKEIPNITIATDVICGFPGETQEEFEDTIKAIKETKPDIVNVSRYWSRDRTLAARRNDQIPDKIAMQRSEKLSKIARQISLENNKKWIGWSGEILINERGQKQNQWKGRNFAYKSVLLEGNLKMGQKINVQIKSATVNDLIADFLIN